MYLVELLFVLLFISTLLAFFLLSDLIKKVWMSQGTFKIHYFEVHYTFAGFLIVLDVVSVLSNRTVQVSERP